MCGVSLAIAQSFSFNGAGSTPSVVTVCQADHFRTELPYTSSGAKGHPWALRPLGA